MCCPNWTQAYSHIIGYIPGPIGSLFAIAPTHFLEWQLCHPVVKCLFYLCRRCYQFVYFGDIKKNIIIIDNLFWQLTKWHVVLYKSCPCFWIWIAKIDIFILRQQIPFWWDQSKVWGKIFKKSKFFCLKTRDIHYGKTHTDKVSLKSRTDLEQLKNRA